MTEGRSDPDYYFTLNRQIRQFDELGITNWAKSAGTNGKTIWTFYCDGEQLIILKLRGVKFLR